MSTATPVQKQIFTESATEGMLWAPYMEWSFTNPSYSGNPFDLVTSATFTHAASGETRNSGMFYAGDNIWKLRFTGTRTGEWTFTTTSADPDLDGHSGTVVIQPNANTYGFVMNVGNKWARQVSEEGSLEAFIPNFVMAFSENPRDYTSELVEQQIQTFFGDHGFNGFFVFMAANWVDIDSGTRWNNTHSRDPDPRSFEALERIIIKTHTAGGVVHIWYVGDCERHQCAQAGFGSNGARSPEEQRVLRYIAARLGPLPGWIMSYGFDNDEHATTEDLRLWGNFLRAHLGWNLFLGARDQGQNIVYTFWPEASWYSRGNWFNGVSYNDAVDVIDSNPDVPHSFDERWWKSRLDEEGQRRLRWKLALAGGASAIWAADEAGAVYSQPHWFKTAGTFWNGRFLSDMVRANQLTDGYALKSESNTCYVFYKEDATIIQMDLSGMVGSQSAVAVDTRLAYAEINLGILAPINQTWHAPYQSDWAIAVGNFDRQAAATAGFQPEPLHLSNNSYLPLITSGIAADTCGY